MRRRGRRRPPRKTPTGGFPTELRRLLAQLDAAERRRVEAFARIYGNDAAAELVRRILAELGPSSRR